VLNCISGVAAPHLHVKMVDTIVKTSVQNLMFGPVSLNPIFRPQGPSEHIGEVFECIRVVCRIELAYANGSKRFGIFSMWESGFANHSGNKKNRYARKQKNICRNVLRNIK